jgi:periplasmic protein TonB
MPHDLFGHALVQRPYRSARRKGLTVFSVALHAVVIAAIVIVQVFAVGPLPFPRRPLVFEEIRLVHLARIHVPAPRRPAGTQAALLSRGQAPTIEPRAITPDTGLENVASDAATGAGVGVDGIADVDSIGRTEAVAPSPPPPPLPQPPVHLHKGIDAPTKIVEVTPVYPPIARDAHVKGIVILEAVIDVHGNVTSVQVVRSIPLLDQAAADAVRQWRYTPARLNGQPVPVVVTVTINFSMQ